MGARTLFPALVATWGLVAGCADDLITAPTSPTAKSGPRFPAASMPYQDVSRLPLDAESGAMIQSLGDTNWNLRLDASFAVLEAGAEVPRRRFTPTKQQNACDLAPVPLPPGGRIEGSRDYACSAGDCHLLVSQGRRLYELYQSGVTGGGASGGEFSAECLVVWDLTRDYWASREIGAGYARGDGCNGADAADLPIAPLLLRADEVTAGAVEHALRFTVPNEAIRAGVYVHPATHLGDPQGGGSAPPYGARLRLRANYDLSALPSDGARVVARALQKYGMLLADGGGTFLSASDDIGRVLDTSALSRLAAADFEVVDGGPRIDYESQRCVRQSIVD